MVIQSMEMIGFSSQNSPFKAMSRKILVLNSGSSSVKYRLFAVTGKADCVPLVSGQVERIGEAASGVADHRQAIHAMVKSLESGGYLAEEELLAVGHRVVHGGESFNQSVITDDRVIAAIRAAIPLAPLHNPPNLEGIEACRDRWPRVPQVAVFDTAFHQTLTAEAYRYAIPDSAYRDYHIRRYGFHGTSFAHITRSMAEYLGRPRESLNLIVLNLCNGASACAIRAGRSIDTSMGMTPLAGLMMGTRGGDLDPGVILFWLEQLGESAENISRWLNRDSGLKGIAGTNDMRDVLARAAHDEPDARLALAMYVHRIRHYLGAYRALLPKLDGLVFTGGVGEHAAAIRAAVCRDLGHLGLHLDEAANAGNQSGIAELQSPLSAIKILVVPADEEAEIARQSIELLGNQGLLT
jgi:acetate kinase